MRTSGSTVAINFKGASSKEVYSWLKTELVEGKDGVGEMDEGDVEA